MNSRQFRHNGNRTWHATRKLWVHRGEENVTIRIAKPTDLDTPETELQDDAEAMAKLLADALPLMTFNALAFILHKMATT